LLIPAMKKKRLDQSVTYDEKHNLIKNGVYV